ncbi:MAG: SRPBCC family protein [Hyphomicrobium sp.]
MKRFAIAALFAISSAGSAFALDAHYSKDTTASAADAWAAIGDFCGIQNWHPALEKCELSSKDGKTLRTLHLKGGGTVLEELVEQNDKTMTQTYIILDGVLPVANYKSTLKVVAKGDGATYDWSGHFDAKKGVADDESLKTMNGVYAAGVDALVAKTSK